MRNPASGIRNVLDETPLAHRSNISELDASLSDHRRDLDLSAKRLDVATQAGNAMIGAGLEPGKLGLRHIRRAGEFGLRDLEILAELPQRELANFGFGTRCNARHSLPPEPRGLDGLPRSRSQR